MRRSRRTILEAALALHLWSAMFLPSHDFRSARTKYGHFVPQLRYGAEAPAPVIIIKCPSDRGGTEFAPRAKETSCSAIRSGLLVVLTVSWCLALLSSAWRAMAWKTSTYVTTIPWETCRAH